MRRQRVWLCFCGLAIGWVGCAGKTGKGAAPGDPREKAPTKTVSGPAEVRTPAGATLQVPSGLEAIQRAAIVELKDPDGAARVVVVEVKASSAAAAVARAWDEVAPGFERKLEQKLQPPPREGWDEIYVESYAPRATQRAQAVARRKGPMTWVALVRGTAASLDKRGAQIRTFLASLKAPGVKEEDLSKATPRSIVAGRAELVAFVEQAMKATGTPGMALAVVEQGKVVLAEGFGVREKGQSRPVTPDTLMMIGSVSKSLTTLLMARLADEGKLGWTQPVRELLPRFAVDDEQLTRSLTVEQLVCACAGLPRKDLPLILAYGHKRPADVFAELATMRPSTKLKETFQYQNHMVAAGGYLAGRVFSRRASYGVAYDRAMQQRIFDPLGMRETTLDHRAALRQTRRATPHSQDLAAVHRVVPLRAERFAVYIRPSGGIWSTARDMARYVMLELGRGVAFGGKRLVSEANLTHRWQPQAQISSDVAYGLGLVISRHKGLLHLSHNGGTMGFASHVSFWPEKGLGLVILSNGTGGHLVSKVVATRLKELWFGIDLKARQLLEYALKVQKEEIAKFKKRSGPPDPRWIGPILGKHHNAEIGAVTIRKRGKQYRLDAGEYNTRLVQYDRPDGKRVLVFVDPPLAGLELVPLPAEEGSFEMTRAQERYVFRRVR